MEYLKDLKKAVKALEKAKAEASKSFESLMNNEQVTDEQRNFARRMFNDAQKGKLRLDTLSVNSVIKQFNNLG